MLEKIKYPAPDSTANEFGSWDFNQVKLTLKLTLYPLFYAAQGRRRDFLQMYKEFCSCLNYCFLALDKTALEKHHQNVNLQV